MSQEIEVLVVGAGPTGLTLACTLAERGINFRIIDTAPGAQTGSRGKGIQPRSLELFDDLGIVERIAAHGVLGLPIRQYDETGQSRKEALHEQQPPRPDAPYLTTLITPQWRVEEALRAKLSQCGGGVEFGIELVSFEQDAEYARVQLSGPEGVEATTTRWLVGCDGGKSAVRRIAGISFIGETLETHRMLVGDVHAGGLDRNHWHMWRSPEGFAALCPLPSTDVFQYQASLMPGQESDLSLDHYQQVLNRRSRRTDIRLSEPSWMSLWRANVRMVDRYRAGRVFLAGDAAHVHSPAGGQGMNTGIQDAYNLGWKLAAVLGGAEERLLDTYQQERLPVAADVIGLSNELMAASVANRSITVRRDEKTLQLGIGYRQSSLTCEMRPEAGGLRAGDRAPDATGLKGPDGACRMFDLLRGPKVTLLGFGARWQRVIETCQTEFGGVIQCHIIAGELAQRTHFADTEGHARTAYAADALFIVRPDNYVGMVTLESDLESIKSYLARITPGTGARPS